MNLENISARFQLSQKGILFRDITSLLENKKAFQTAIKKMQKIIVNSTYKNCRIESRGFILRQLLLICIINHYCSLEKKTITRKNRSQNLIRIWNRYY